MMEMQEIEDQKLLADIVNFSNPVVDEQPVAIPEPKEPSYIQVRDNPIVQSVGNSGWQISDIWREMRVDDFYDFR